MAISRNFSPSFKGDRASALVSHLNDASAVTALQHAAPFGPDWLGGHLVGVWDAKEENTDLLNPGPSGMSLDVLRSFAKLGELCNYTSAAAQLGISQPTLSKQIQRLEDLLGEALFARSRGGTALTVFGERFYNEIAPAVRNMGRVWKSGIRVARGEAKRMSVGCTPSAIDVMTKAINTYRERYSDVQFDIHVLTSDLQMQMVRDRQLSVAFARWPGTSDLDGFLVAEDRLTFIYPRSLAAEVSGIDSPKVRELPFIRLERSIAPGFEGFVDRFLSAKGLSPIVTHHVNESLVQLRLVASGAGVAVMHDSGLEQVVNADSVCIEAIRQAGMTWQVGMFWHPDDVSSATRELVETVRYARAQL